MDAQLILLALAGSAAGLAATALPGVHVNLLALGLLALFPDAGEGGAAFLVGALAAAPFGLALSSTLLGGGEDDARPAHALAREGRAADAVALQAWGAFAGLASALAFATLLLPLARLVGDVALRAMPWLLLAVAAALVLSEPRRPAVHRALVVAPWGPLRLRGEVRFDGAKWRVGGRFVHDPHGLLAEGARDVRVERAWRRGPLSAAGGAGLALLVLALSGALGLVALRMGARSPVGLPSSILLPLLAGLFAAPALLSLRARHVRITLRATRPPRGEVLRAAGPAALASSLLGLAPGVSASHVQLLTPRARSVEARLLSTGAINGGAVAFTLLAWFTLGKARAGALVAASVYAPPAPGPTAWLAAAALALLAGGAACLLARGLTRPAARGLAALPRRAGLALLVAAVALTTGAWGLAVLAAATAVGLMATRLGVRAGLCMGAILVPALLRAWGVA